MRQRYTAADAARTYTVWTSMNQRCRSKTEKNRDYWNVSVDPRWSDRLPDFAGFAAFIADVGVRPSAQHSLDRIDGTGGYTPDNCRWATARVQAQNTKRNINITHDGETLCLSEWARRTGVGRETIRKRLARGWTTKEALAAPAHSQNAGWGKRRELPATVEARMVKAIKADESGHTIAAQFAVAPAVVHRVAKRNGLSIRRRRHRLTNAQVDALVARLMAGAVAEPLAREFAVSSSTVCDIARSRGLHYTRKNGWTRCD